MLARVLHTEPESMPRQDLKDLLLKSIESHDPCPDGALGLAVRGSCATEAWAEALGLDGIRSRGFGVAFRYSILEYFIS